jgi:predicted phage terminase large subunit-like protein
LGDEHVRAASEIAKLAPTSSGASTFKQTRDKVLRLTELAPYFENATIRSNRAHEDLIMEYLQFTKGWHDDILDALQLAFARLKEPLVVIKDLFGD